MRKLFRTDIPDDLVVKILRCVGFTGLSDGKELRHQYIDTDILAETLTELWPYYIPCHAKRYLKNDLTYYNLITIVRHVLRTRGRTLIAKERKSQGSSFTTYRLDGINSPTLHATPTPFLLTFE